MRTRIYFANHRSHGDFLLIWASLPTAVRYQTRPVAAADYWLCGRLRQYIAKSAFRAVLIDRSHIGSSANPVQQMSEALAAGDSLILFPEGTRNLDDGVMPFKSGLFHLACKHPEVELVPIWIDNLGRVMPKGAFYVMVDMSALIGKHLFEDMCRIPVEVEYASEFRYRNPVVSDKDVLIAMSQSGETADTLAAVELARKAGAFVFGICNVVGSSIARATDSGAYIHVGPEIGVASTKAFTGQVTVMAMLALAVGREKGTVTEEYYREVAKGLLELPAVLEDVLGLGDRIADLSKIFTYAHNFIYLGRGYNYPTALEGALKLKEISYIHAEGYPAAEMKHGAIALIDNEMPTVAIATPDNTYEKTASNIEEIRARGGKIIAVIARDDTHVRRSADYTIEVPVVTDCLMPIVVSVPLQLLAYYIAVNKGRNVDQPRNLAKSVTVE